MGWYSNHQFTLNFAGRSRAQYIPQYAAIPCGLRTDNTYIRDSGTAYVLLLVDSHRSYHRFVRGAILPDYTFS